MAQPGLTAQLAKSGAIKPVSAEVQAAVAERCSPVWRELGSVDGTLHGVYFKGSNKSTIWYIRRVFEAVSPAIEPPRTWHQLLEAARTLAVAGKSALSIAGADGWTLTDWFENVYLRTAGSENYGRLARHEIPSTDPTVRTTLEVFFGEPGLLASGASETNFPKSATDFFGEPAKAAMVFEEDFDAGVVDSATNAVAGGDTTFFPFPSIKGSSPAVVAGGDMAVQFKDDKATLELMKCSRLARARFDLGAGRRLPVLQQEHRGECLLR